MNMTNAPTATATTAAAPARTMNLDIVGLHAGRPRPVRAWGVVRTAVEIARRVVDGRSVRAVVQPRGHDDVRITRRAHADQISAVSRMESTATAARIERVAWWSRDLTVPTGTPTTWAIVATGSPA